MDRLVFFFGRYFSQGCLQFEVFSLEYLVASQAAKVVDAIAPHQEFRLFMLTGRHNGQITPFYASP